MKCINLKKVRGLAKYQDLKLEVDFKDSISAEDPINHRRYTFVDSKDGNASLSIGLRYNFKKLASKGNEILGEWAVTEGEYILYFHIHLDKCNRPAGIGVRNAIIRRNLVDCIKQILKADIKLINKHAYLKQSNVIVCFKSSLPYYDKIENWGSVDDYIGENSFDFIPDSKLELDVIKSLLKPYIDKEVVDLYDEKKNYSMQKIEIISLENLGSISSYKVVLRLRVKVSDNKFENLIIEFKIDNGNVLVSRIK